MLKANVIKTLKIVNFLSYLCKISFRLKDTTEI